MSDIHELPDPRTRRHKITVQIDHKPDDGGGHTLTLSCGHTVWSSIVPPDNLTRCIVCLHELIREARDGKG